MEPKTRASTIASLRILCTRTW